MSKERILQEARVLFSKKGYSQTSLREIAERVGVKTPSLYAHFASKEALYHAVYTEVNRELTEFFRKLVLRSATLAPIERIRVLLQGVEKFYRDRRQLAEFSLRAAVEETHSSGLRQVHLEDEAVVTTALREAYVDAIGAGEVAGGVEQADAFVATALALMDGLFLELHHYSPELYEQRSQLVWAYLHNHLSHNLNGA